MSDEPRQLAETQRWMQAVIMHPDGIARGIDSQAARAEIDVSPEEVESVITRSKALSSIERLQVYGNAYFTRLIGILQDEFPALRHAVGEDAFDGFALGFLQTYPSESYTLADLSIRFPQYLDETRPPVEEGEKRPDWIDFLIDLAALERTYSDVFSSPGPEGDNHLTPEDLQAIPADRMADVRLVPVDCLRLMTVRFPVHLYATAVRRSKNPVPPDPAATRLVISRREFIVRRLAVSPVQYELLQGILDGCRLGSAIARAVEATDADVDTLAGQLQQWFKEWAAAQFFRTVEMPDGDDE